MLSNWQRFFPHCQPIAHHLREAFPSRWVRFHSLPGSKRYAENEAEYAIILERHNRVLGELAREGETIAVVTTSYSSTPEPVRSEPELLEFDPNPTLWRSIPMHETDEDFGETYWHLFVSERTWTPGLFDPLVRRVADDAIRNVMFLALDCKWLLHPYDGGMDLILETSAERDRFKERFQDWLSPRADGK
jgi:hypothetical protein